MNIPKLVVWTAVASAALTVAALAMPSLSFSDHNPQLHLAAAVAEGMIGVLAGYFALGRLRRWRRLDHLLLGAGLGFLGVSNLLFVCIPAIFWQNSEAFGSWGATAGRLGGIFLLACSALVSPRRLRLTARQFFFSTLAIVDGLAAIALAVVLLRNHLPDAVTADGELNPVFAGMIVLGIAAHALAAVGFAMRARHSVDALRSALAVACALGAAALVNSLAYPTEMTEWIALADVLRFLFYLVIGAGLLRELDAQWHTGIAAAALDERRRIARDLHDGLAQELASIQRNLRWVEGEDPFVQRALASAERGLAGARQAIAVLGDAPERNFAEQLAETAGTVADRVGTKLVLDLKPTVEVGPAEREALVRIAAEAISNAARHGGADVVRVELDDRPRVCMRITDTGTGFNPSLLAWTGGGGGFGLSDMQDRALEIGARYRLKSRPGKGTDVEVAL
jgi:signal transduction histidine kinase